MTSTTESGAISGCDLTDNGPTVYSDDMPGARGNYDVSKEMQGEIRLRNALAGLNQLHPMGKKTGHSIIIVILVAASL